MSQIVKVVLCLFIILETLFECHKNHVAWASTAAPKIKLFQGINFTDKSLVKRLSQDCMKKLHDKVDGDDDGNISPSEGADFIKGEDLKKQSGKNLPGFETDKDGNITQREFWEAWERSEVHNWTVDRMGEWFANDINMPNFVDKLKIYSITGSALPIFAVNKTLTSAFVDHRSDQRMRLQFKSLELILGYQPHSSLLKDVLVSISLVLACSGITFAYHVQKKSQQAMQQMQERLKNLQDQFDDEGVTWMSISEQGSNGAKDCDEHSIDSDTSLQTQIDDLQEELVKTKACLEKAEEQLKMNGNNQNFIPPKLVLYLKETFQMEFKHLKMQHSEAKNKVEKARAQFVKANRKWGIFNQSMMSSKQTDKFDGEVDQAENLLKQFHLNRKDFRKRWYKIELICKQPIISSSSSSSTIASSGSQLVKSSTSSLLLVQQQQADSETSSLTTTTTSTVAVSCTAATPADDEVVPQAPSSTTNGRATNSSNGHAAALQATSSAAVTQQQQQNEITKSSSPMLKQRQLQKQHEISEESPSLKKQAKLPQKLPHYSSSKSLVPNSQTEEEFKLMTSQSRNQPSNGEATSGAVTSSAAVTSRLPAPRVHHKTNNNNSATANTSSKLMMRQQVSDPTLAHLRSHHVTADTRSRGRSNTGDDDAGGEGGGGRNLKTAQSLPDFQKIVKPSSRHQNDNAMTSPPPSYSATLAHRVVPSASLDGVAEHQPTTAAAAAAGTSKPKKSSGLKKILKPFKRNKNSAT